jgi:multiple sugar transport system substrate-binding protein
MFLAACGSAPSATTEPTTAAAPEAAATVAPTEAAAAEPTEAAPATEETTAAPEAPAEAATVPAEVTEEAAGAAAEPTAPPPTLTPAPNAVQLEYWEMDWGLTEPLQILVNEFNTQNPDIYVKLTQLSWGDYTQKLQGAIAAGSPPDISSGDSGLPFNFSAQGQALELDDLYEKWKQDGRFDDLTKWAQDKWYYNGHYVGASWQIDYRAIFYRTDLFEAAGIQPPTTHDELLAAAIKLTDKSKEQYGICVPGKQGSYDTDQFYMTLVLQNGGGLADPQGNPTFDTPEHLAALKFEQELVAAAGPPGTASYTFGETNQLYQQGQCAMTMQGGWFVGTLERENPEMYAVTGILPALKGQGPNAVERIVGFYNPWMIYNQSKHPEEAKKFLDFMMQKDNLRSVYTASGGAHGSVYMSLRSDPLYEARPMTKEAASQVEKYAVDYWYPNNAAAVGIGSMGTGIADIIVNPVLAGARSPEDALKDAQTQLSPLFEKQQ